MTNAHTRAIDNITSKYNDIMGSQQTSEYDKAVLVQGLTDSYDPRTEFSSIVQVNGVDMTTICNQNAQVLQNQQDAISRNFSATIAEKTTMYTNLQHEIQSVIDRINANKLSLASLNSFKDTVISTYERNIADLLQKAKNAQDLINKINAANLAALTEQWDSWFKASDGIIADYMDTLSVMAGEIASTILNNEAEMKTMNIDYKHEIVDTHIRNYRKLFAAVNEENDAFSIRKPEITNIYSAKGKQNDYDVASINRVSSIGRWLFSMYIIAFIVLAVVLFRYNTTMSRNSKLAVAATAAAYPFVIQYIELYAYFFYIYLVNKTYYISGDLSFEPK